MWNRLTHTHRHREQHHTDHNQHEIRSHLTQHTETVRKCGEAGDDHPKIKIGRNATKEEHEKTKKKNRTEQTET